MAINHILFIIIMATKTVKKVQGVEIRSSKRLRSRAQLTESALDHPDNERESDQSDNNNQFSIHNEQQLKLKTEKQSTSPINNEGLMLTNKTEKEMRITRSQSNISHLINPQTDIQNEQLTPDNNHSSKNLYPQTSKKFIKTISAIEFNDSTQKKIITKIPQSFISPYSQVRKSYRKIRRREIISIPYRKCHDALEGRIVTIMNKLENDKNCLKDFQSLIEKMGKIASKDLTNRYIISGIKTIIDLSIKKNIYDMKIIEKMQEEQKKLHQRINQEIELFEEYAVNNQSKICSATLLGCLQYKHLMMRKLYQAMRKQYPERKKQIKSTIIQQCSRLLEGDFNLNYLIKFVRSKLETSSN